MEPPCKRAKKKGTSTTHENTFLETLMQELDGLLAQQNCVNNFLKKVEKATRVPPRVQVLVAALFAFLYVAEGYAAACLCNVVVVLVPLYASINSIEHPDFVTDNKWLMYWVIFSFVNFVEFLISWMPSYYMFKFFFLLWCMLPGRISGSEIMYFRVMRPFVMRHKARVNEVVSDAASKVRRVAEKTVDDFIASRRSSRLLELCGATVEDHDADCVETENSNEISEIID